MLAPFQKETLEQESFVKHSVQHNLLYRISEGECATALQAEDGGAVALQSVGRGMWFWIDPDRGASYATAVIGELAERLKTSVLPSVSAVPEHAMLFAEAYSRSSGAEHKLNFNLMAYCCPAVKAPRGVSGNIVRADEQHTGIVAELYFGYNKNIFNTEECAEKMRSDAQNMIKSYDLFLWAVDGKTVSMAAISHRMVRHARISAVYTAPQERKKGYASAVVAAVSHMVIKEGRMPLLYADLVNPDSNKVYRSLGYMQAGAIDEYGFQHKE